MASSYAGGGLDWVWGKLSSPKWLSSFWTGCPGKRLSHHSWRYLKDACMWLLGTWFSGGLGSAGLMLGLNDFKGLFQPKQFHDHVSTESKDVTLQQSQGSSYHLCPVLHTFAVFYTHYTCTEHGMAEVSERSQKHCSNFSTYFSKSLMLWRVSCDANCSFMKSLPPLLFTIRAFSERLELAKQWKMLHFISFTALVYYQG